MIWMCIWVAALGLVLGSFLNVVIARLPEKQSLAFPGSHCPACGKPIRFYDNIPLLSFILLGGRCRDCRARISWRYPAVEAVTALVLAALFLTYGLKAQTVVYGILSLHLIAIAFIDARLGIIPNALVVSGGVLGAVLVPALQVEKWTTALLGAASGAALMLAIAGLGRLFLKKESMGMGDIKLYGMIGLYVGFPDVVVTLFFAVYAAAVFIGVGLALRKIKLRDAIPFGPFIAIGTLVFLVWGRAIVGWYLRCQ
jgi:leader peptidase (prepilin peptidase)/N-methyltransferase